MISAHTPSRPAIVVAHSGKQHAYRHAAAVQQCGCLARFITSGYYKREQLPDRLAAKVRWLDARLDRRRLAGLDVARVTRRWRFELPELIVRGVCGNGQYSDRCVFRRDAKFDRWVAARFATAGDMFWGFQAGALESLRAARQAGVLAVVEFSTAHVTWAIELLQREAERHPEWADSISNFRFPEWYRDRLEREPHAADVCIAASGFAKRSLLAAGVAERRIRLLPLGADLSAFIPSPRSERGPLRVLFVGGVGQRKGVKYLLEAVQRLASRQVELILVGPLVGSGAGLRAYRGHFTHVGRVDQREVLRHMRHAHVLVLPSVFEGFGLVIPEAMATGMPVIASTHSIGPEIVREGVDGFVLAPDDVDGLADRLQWLATHRRQACSMGNEAVVRARQFSWTAHAQRVAALVNELWSTPKEVSRQAMQ